MSFEPLDPVLEAIGRDVVDSALRVHSVLGPGLLESVYKSCLAAELGKRGHSVQFEFPVPVIYDELKLECGFRIDLMIDDRVVIEVKALAVLPPIWEAQLLTYLKLSGRRLGYLLNFTVPLMKDGISRRIV